MNADEYGGQVRDQSSRRESSIVVIADLSFSHPLIKSSAQDLPQYIQQEESSAKGEDL